MASAVNPRPLPIGISSPPPYKRRAPPPSFTAPLPRFFFPLSTPEQPSHEHRRCRTFTAVARPPRCRPSPGEALAERTVRSSLCYASADELWCTGAAGSRASVSAPPRSGTLCPRRRQSTVDRACLAGPRIYPLKNKSRPKFPDILQRSPFVFPKSTRGPVLQILHLSPSIFLKLIHGSRFCS
jgi:hypothetical protein